MRGGSAHGIGQLLEFARARLGQRVADRVADTIGSWPFIITQTIILISWITLNVIASINHWGWAWDVYPFILLNLALSFQAAYSGPVIMMSQNRQSSKDKLLALQDELGCPGDWQPECAATPLTAPPDS